MPCVSLYVCLGRGFAAGGNCFVLDIYGVAAQLSMTGLRRQRVSNDGIGWSIWLAC